MKKRIFSVLAIMCSMMFMMNGCGGANETDLNDDGINAVDNTMKFSKLFEKDVIAYFGYLKDDDDLIGKDQEISGIGFFAQMVQFQNIPWVQKRLILKWEDEVLLSWESWRK